jgi:hypothetical protein
MRLRWLFRVGLAGSVISLSYTRQFDVRSASGDRGSASSEKGRSVMATSRQFVCTSCPKVEWLGRLFDTLYQFVHSQPTACEFCGNPRYLKLTFPFGLEAGDYECKVLAAFLPEPEHMMAWDDSSGGHVTFYPFLVIMASIEDGHHSVWLPYWHVVEFDDDRPTQTKYGQWASHMDLTTMANLLTQARKAGFSA